MLVEQIRNDLKDAMRSKDVTKLKTLRSIITEIQRKQSERANSEEIDDNSVKTIIASEIKKRNEAIEGFKAAGAKEREKEEEEEKTILETYLPQMDDKELETKIKQILKDNNFDSMNDMGAAMKLVQSEIGTAADGKKMAKIVKENLN